MHRRDEKCIKILVGKPEKKRSLEELGIDDRILEWIFGKQGGKAWPGFI